MGPLVIAQGALMAAAEVANLLTAPASQGGAALNDLKVSASTYGKVIQCGYGTQRVPGNIIWSKPLKQYTHNGKGLGQSAYTYNWTGAVSLGEGPIDDVLQIWADTKIVFDKTGQYGADLCHQNAGTYPNPLRWTLYYGTDTQMPDPNLIDLVGEANATAHRGMAYVVFDNIPVTNYGNRVPNYTFVVSYSGSSQNFIAHGFDIEQDGTSSGVVPQEALAFQDWTRSRAYFTVNTPRGLTYCDINSGNTILGKSKAEIFVGFPDGDISLVSFVVPGFDGNVYCVGNASYPYDGIMKVDGDALVCTGEYLMNTGGQNVTNAIPLQIFGTNFLAVLQENGPIQVFCTDTMGILNGLDPLEYTVQPTDDNTYIGPGSLTEDTGGNPYAYFFKIGQSNTSTNPLNIYLMDVSIAGAITQTPIGSVAPSAVNPTWNHITSISGMAFDQSDGNLIFGVANSVDTILPGVSEYYIIKVSATSGNVLWAAPVNWIPNFSVGNQQSFTLNAITDNEYCFHGTSGQSYNGAGDTSPSGYEAIYRIDTMDGSYVRQNWAITSTSFEAQTFDGNHGSLLFFANLNPDFSSNQWLLIYTDMADAAAVPVSGVVQNICNRVGLANTDLDVTLLDDAGLAVDGYAIGDSKSAKDALLPLARAFMFDEVESDGLLKFVPRGAASAQTVPNTDLGFIDTKTNALSKETRVQEVDLPRILSVTFFDPNHDYQKAYQYSQRPSNPSPAMYSNNRKQESFDLVMEPDFAKQLADKILYSGWLERTSYQVKLPWTYLPFDATDVITFDLSDNSSVITRILDVNVGADLSLEITACSESAQAYTSSSTTDGGTQYPQDTQTSSTTKLFLFDSPLLRDLDDTGFASTILYWAGGSYVTGWNGVELWRSKDGTSYIDQNGVTVSASWGVCTSILGDTAGPFRTDHINTLKVAMIVGGDNLVSVTNLQMLNGANAAAIWNPLNGVIEIIQFQNVTVNVDGSYTLDTLLRGRRGSELFTGSHIAGDYFVLLADSTGAIASGIQTAGLSLSDLGVQEYYKGVPNGVTLANTPQVNFTDTGRTLKPYAPGHLQATTSSSDIQLNWVRRTRVGGPLIDGTGTVQLSEQDEHYSVDIYDPTGMTVLRTIDVDYHSTTPTATPGVLYTNAEYTADFGSKPASINMIVYQIGTLGRGFGKMYNVVVDGPPTP